jgi:Cu/Ag efflux protein CusF
LPLSDGLVKKIDKANQKVTLSHGPLPNGMPAMTMVFRVKDSAWLEKMKEGQTIRFAAEDINGAMTVVRFEPGK